MKRIIKTLCIVLLLLLAMPQIAGGMLIDFNPRGTPTSYPSSPSFDETTLLSDFNFAFRSEFFDFDIRAFLQEQAPTLASYQGPMFTFEEDVAEMVKLVAHYYGINPKVLLTVMQVQAGLLSRPPLDEMENWVLGYQPHAEEEQDGLCPGDGKSLFSQLILLARRLNEGYFDWRDFREGVQETLPVLTFADGSQRTAPEGSNAATFAVLYTLAEVNSQERWQELVTDTPQGFYRTYIALFGEDPLQAADIRAQAGPYPGTIQFPWPNGQMWYYTKRPPDHDSALDFAPGGYGCLYSACFGNWIVAAASGTVVDTSHLWIKIDHGNGWMTGYFHTPGQDKISNGAKVCRGERIGHPGCCGSDGCTYCMPCGSSCPGCCASGTHTHFMLYRDGSPETWVGKTISGWTVQSDGCLTKEGSLPQCVGSRFTSDISKDCCCCSSQTAQAGYPSSLETTAVILDDTQALLVTPTFDLSPPRLLIDASPTLLPTSRPQPTPIPTPTATEVRVAQTSVQAVRTPPASASYRIPRSVFGTGGDLKTSAHYVMQDTSGQTTGVAWRQSGSYVLRSGYWGRIGAAHDAPYAIYLPIVIKQQP